MDDLFGKRIKELRLKSKMSQAQLAQKLHVTAGAVSQWENGITRPNFDTFDALTEILNTTGSYIFGSTDNPHRPTTDELRAEKEEEIARQMSFWSLDDAQLIDSNRRRLFLLAKNGSGDDVKNACIILDALRLIIPDFYDDKK